MGTHRKPPPRLAAATLRATNRHGRPYTCIDRVLEDAARTITPYHPRHAKPKDTRREQH